MKTFSKKEVTRRLRAILEDVTDHETPIEVPRSDGTSVFIVSRQDFESIERLNSELELARSNQNAQLAIGISEKAAASGKTDALKDDSEHVSPTEERYRELFDDSPIAIWVEDWSEIKTFLESITDRSEEGVRAHFAKYPEQLRTAYGLASEKEISQAAVRLFNEDSVESLLDHTAPDMIVEEELESFLDMILSFDNQIFSVDQESLDIDGDRKEIIIRRQVVIPPAHRADWSRVIYALEDITERVRLEEQLVQAQKMEAVGQLTGGVAHDFNNLLAVIQGNADLMVGTTGVNRELIEPILRATARGADLTQHLLAFSRKQALRPSRLDVLQLVSGMSHILSRTLGENIEIVQHSDSELWPAFADAGQLENAILNLALNARDAMTDGGVLTIECSNLQVEDLHPSEAEDITPGDYVVLAVSDTGHGMAAEVKKRAFEPFYTTKQVGSGSGLGLSMIYGFAKQSGGHLSIDSEQDHGTTVKLYLQRDAGSSFQIESSPTQPEDHRGGESVLLIEDDRDVREMTKTMLTSIGYRVTAVGDTSAAQKALREEAHFDVVLSDVVLRGRMSGPQFVEMLTQDHPDLKVLYMSGYTAHTAVGEDIIRQGASLLAKPFTMSQLGKLLREVLD